MCISGDSLCYSQYSLWQHNIVNKIEWQIIVFIKNKLGKRSKFFFLFYSKLANSSHVRLLVSCLFFSSMQIAIRSRLQSLVTSSHVKKGLEVVKKTFNSFLGFLIDSGKNATIVCAVARVQFDLIWKKFEEVWTLSIYIW